MTYRKVFLALIFSLIFAAAGPLWAASRSGHSGGAAHGSHNAGHGSAGKHGSAMNHPAADMEHGGMNHDGHMGKLIHQSRVEGHRLAYHLIDMQEQMKEMENMPEIAATHHLMLYLQNAQGQRVTGAEVGFLIEGPDGSKQRVMAMGMEGGYGADVTLKKKGTYTVKAKAVGNGAKIMDRFAYTVN